MKIKSINPFNYEIIGEVESSSPEEVTLVVKKARAAFKGWSEMPVTERSKKVRSLIPVFEKRAEEIAKLTAQEMGMPVGLARESTQTESIDFINLYCDIAEKCLAPKITFEDDREVHTVYREPVGVVAAIVPWNFPLSNFVWGCAQALIAGNTVVMKHSEEVQLFAKLLEEMVTESDIPSGVFNLVYGDGAVGDALAHADVDMIAFTGSTKTGKHLAKVAAEKLIPYTAELGGSAPGIIFEDANIDAVLETIYVCRFTNCGQMCDALKRAIIHESKAKEFISKLNKLVENKKIGNPLSETTDFGPLVAKRQLVLLQEQVEDALQNGAISEIGGGSPVELDGAFYKPTILTNVNKHMRVWKEEVFGPVLPLMTFKTEGEAIELANSTEYGLGSYIFTDDADRFDRVAIALQSGMVAHNNASYIRACNPFGGYKQSGIGRIHGEYGFHDVTQIKVVAKEK